MLFKSGAVTYYDFSGCYLLYLLLRHRDYISVRRLTEMKGSGSSQCGWRDVVVKNSDLVYSNAVKSQKKSPISKAKARVPVSEHCSVKAKCMQFMDELQ